MNQEAIDWLVIVVLLHILAVVALNQPGGESVGAAATLCPPTSVNAQDGQVDLRVVRSSGQ